MPALVAFDLDDTLAPSKSPLPPAMADALVRLLGRGPVCIISGGRWEQFESQVLTGLSDALERAETDDAALGRLHLMPTCGTRYHRHDGGSWELVESVDLDPDRRAQALAALEREARRLGLWEERTWGPALEDRGSQITFSALGQNAPVEAKKAWDPDGAKRESLRAAVAPLLPGLEVRAGGSTSVDITPAGVDKAFGMRRLAELTGIATADMLFVGDRLEPGGNDRPVLDLGVPCIAVNGWEQTLEIVEGLLID